MKKMHYGSVCYMALCLCIEYLNITIEIWQKQSLKWLITWKERVGRKVNKGIEKIALGGQSLNKLVIPELTGKLHFYLGPRVIRADELDRGSIGEAVELLRPDFVKRDSFRLPLFLRL